ncbi:dienelactone hydrolase family protein [Thalassospira sp. HF15]|uniref:dienelactone hydrolase family protein n=1 Tax=Thalassospira sp. HF15 TaxID=2722755 RepID=UPI00142F8737|nr:dienelactone hydrolase family protein [Thalassospira sp. HF15]NIY76461.1 dienelactone hydrolase family protein [Thalassospira sp. HF15]
MMQTITASDGHVLDCWFEAPVGERRGGIVILQEIFGVTDQLKGVARKYAALGYEVAIPALFDRTEHGAVVDFNDFDRARTLMMASQLPNTLMDIDAAVQALAAKGGKVAVIGFCWGGGLALRSAQTIDIAAGVSFYGTRIDQYLDKPLHKPFLAHFGLSDGHVPVEMIEDAKEALPGMEVHMYEAGHAFANEARPSAYVPAAAEVAHARTVEFLALHLGT